MSHSIAQELPTNEQHNPPSIGIKKGVAIMVLGISSLNMAGCSFEDDSTDSSTPTTALPNWEPYTGPASPSDELTDSIHRQAHISYLLLDRFPNAEDLTEAVASLTEDEKQKLESLTGIMEALDASEVIDDVDRKLVEPADARSTIASFKNEALKIKTGEAIDAMDAHDAVSEASSYLADADLARAEVGDIEDPQIKNDAMRVIDALDAANVIERIKYSIISEPGDFETARTEASNITDEAIRTKALDAIKALETQHQMFHSGQGVSSPEYTMTEQWAKNAVTAIDLEVLASGAAVVELQRRADDIKVELKHWDREARTEIDENITEQTRQHNGLIQDPNASVEIEPLKDPAAVIDLSALKSYKSVRDIIDVIEGVDDMEDLELEQFAEIYAQDGKIEFSFIDDGSLDEVTMGHLTDVFKNVAPLLSAAFANGDLVSVRFIASDDFEPYYVPSTREVYMILPKDNSTSVDQLRSAMVHEVVHALTRSVFNSTTTASTEEIQQIQDACTALRDTAYSAAESHLGTVYPELLEDLRAAVRPEHRAAVDVIIELIKNHKIDELMLGSFEFDTSASINDCYPHSFKWVIYEAANKDNQGEWVGFDELDYISETEAYKEVASKWYEAEAFYSVYSKLNESEFVDTEYWGKEYIGHSQDDAAETVASVTDAAISFTAEFALALKKMSSVNKEAAIKALRMSLDLISNRHPSLVGYLSELESQILTLANQ